MRINRGYYRKEVEAKNVSTPYVEKRVAKAAREIMFGWLVIQ